MPISRIYLSYYRYVIINFEHVVNFEKKGTQPLLKLIYSFQVFSEQTIEMDNDISKEKKPQSG